MIVVAVKVGLLRLSHFSRLEVGVNRVAHAADAVLVIAAAAALVRGVGKLNGRGKLRNIIGCGNETRNNKHAGAT